MSAAAVEKKEKPKKLPFPWKLGVGAVAGIVGTTCIFPLDTIKTRLQAAKTATPVSSIVNNIIKEFGWRGFYKGLLPNLVGVTPEKALKMGVNEYLREHLEESDGSISVPREIMAGGGAGFTQVIATNPMEITKIRMQMNADLPVAERRTLGQIVNELGFLGMYRGLPATLLRDVSFSVLFFPGYANLKKLFADEQGHNSMGSVLLAGGIAGSLAGGAVTPADVIKTRLQVKGGIDKYVNVRECFAKILREEGPGAFFKGAVPRMCVIGPLFAIAQWSFETTKEYLIKSGKL